MTGKKAFGLAMALIVILSAGAIMERRQEDRPPPPMDTLTAKGPGTLSTLSILPEINSLSDANMNSARSAFGYTLVNVFGSWCGPCRIEHPHLVALQEFGARIVGIAYRDDEAAALSFLAELGNPYVKVMWDPNGIIDGPFDLASVPVTFLFDKRGALIWRHNGRIEEAEVVELKEILSGTPRETIAATESSDNISDLFWLAKSPAADMKVSTPKRPMDLETLTSRLAMRLKNDPKDLDGWVLLGRSYLELGQPDRAGVAFEHVLQLDPENEVAGNALVTSRKSQ